jgi:hypothetical protein
MKNLKHVMVAITISIFVSPFLAHSATHSVDLVDVTVVDSGGTLELNLSGDATWQYDDVAGVLTGTGTYIATAELISQPYFTHTITNLSIVAGGAASATSYSCTEGTAGAALLVNVCDQYNFGPNNIDNGGGFDDVDLGPSQSLADYDDNFGGSWDGTTLTMINQANCCNDVVKTMTFQVVPTSGFDTLYGVNSSSDGLSVTDPVTGDGELIGFLDAGTGDYATPVSMAVRASDGELFVWNNSSTNLSPPTPSGSLLTVDRCSGLAAPVDASTPLADLVIGGLAFGPNGTLYATSGGAGGLDNALEQIDPATGVGTKIADLSPDVRISGLDFGPDGKLYGLELTLAAQQRLFTIDITNGVLTEVATLSQDIGRAGSIVFDSTGHLIGSGFNRLPPLEPPNILFDIDHTTGIVTNIRPTSSVFVPDGTLRSQNPQGMGFSAACEVSSDVLLDVFDAGVAAGTLVGIGNGNSGAGKLNAFRDLLVEADEALDNGLIADACEVLEVALDRIDGDPMPKDFVTGDAADRLADLIRELRAELGCS